MKRLILLFSLIISNLILAAAGDDCSTSILVSSNGCSTVSQYSNVGITGTINPSCFGAGTNNSMWFRFIASAPTATITVKGASLTTPMISLLGAPPTPPCTGVFPELACNMPASGATSTLTYNSLTVGSLYYIIVDGKNSLTGSFQLCVNSFSPPNNDDPCNAFTLSANNFCSPVDAYSNVGALGENLTSVSKPACFDASGSFNSVYFKFTAIGAVNTVTINGSAAGLNRPQAAIISLTGLCSGTGYNVDACSQAASGANSVIVSSNYLVPGNTYYILVEGFSGNTGAFQVCIQSTTPTSTVVNDECSTAIALCPNNQYFSTTKGATFDALHDPYTSCWD